jgi:hypothetical protein
LPRIAAPAASASPASIARSAPILFISKIYQYLMPHSIS